MRKSKICVLFLGIVLIVILAGSGMLPFSSLGVGSGWEYDYHLDTLTVNGETIGADLYDGYDTTYDYTGPIDGVVYDILSQDQYKVVYDPDGFPSAGLSGTHGLAPVVSVSMSLPWRVDADGNPIDTYAPSSVGYEIEGKQAYEFYYAFSLTAQTHARTFTASMGLITFASAECGSFDIDVGIKVILQETLFGEVEGEFMDAQIIGYDSLDLQLQSGLDWEIVPKYSPLPTYTALGIANREYSDTHYSCDMTVPMSFSSGLVRSGVNLLPYDVSMTYIIQTTLLQKEPLAIGDTGQAQDAQDPPIFVAPFDFRLVAIIVGVAIFALLALLIVTRGRRT